MKVFLVILIVACSLAALRWLRRQQKLIEFDAYVDQAIAITGPDWSLWEEQVSA